MRRFLVLATVLAAATVPAVALAGGWATVKVGSTPVGVSAGSPWLAEVTVLQHGLTPLAGLRPEVRIRKGALRRVFVARPSGTPGVYRVRVTFPAAGTWRWSVWDGFTEYGGARVHTFAPVKIAPAQ